MQSEEQIAKWGNVLADIGGIVLVLIILVVCSLILNQNSESTIKRVSDTTDFTYTVIEVEGMPCLVVDHRPGANFATFGITCDWSQWKGE